jgi:hypothetical protein
MLHIYILKLEQGHVNAMHVQNDGLIKNGANVFIIKKWKDK